MKKQTTHGYIYILTCLITMKEYVGQAKCWKTRWKRHCDAARGGSLFAIHYAIRTYGKETFAITILRRCLTEELDYWEEYYVEKFDTLAPDGYNLTTGGDGCKASEFTSERLSASLKAYWDGLTKEERIEAIRRRVRSEETIEKGKKTWKKNLAFNSAAIGCGMFAAWQRPAERAKRLKTFSDPTYRAAISARRAAFEATPEGARVRHKVSKKLKGRKLSDATRERMSIGQKARAARETPEERKARGSKTSAGCKNRSKKRRAEISTARSEIRRRSLASKTHEELSNYAKKSWKTRRSNLAAAK